MLAARVDTHTRRAAPEPEPEPEPTPTKLATCSRPHTPRNMPRSEWAMGPGPKMFWCADRDGWVGGWAGSPIGRYQDAALVSKVVPNELLPKRASSAEEGTNTLPN